MLLCTGGDVYAAGLEASFTFRESLMEIDIHASLELVHKHVAELGIKLVNKSDSRFMRLLAFLFTFVPGVSPDLFMKRYTTHIGRTIYLPSRWITFTPFQQASILCHEICHHKDQKKLGSPLFILLYLSPQVFGVCGLVLSVGLGLAGVAWWWIGLVALVLLAPLPSPGRAWIEYRGYATTMWVLYRVRNSLPAVPPNIPPQFFSGAYYWMCWDRRKVRSKLERTRRDVVEGGRTVPYRQDLLAMFPLTK
jgi:hypothetical protein